MGTLKVMISELYTQEEKKGKEGVAIILDRDTARRVMSVDQ